MEVEQPGLVLDVDPSARASAVAQWVKVPCGSVKDVVPTLLSSGQREADKVLCASLWEMRHPALLVSMCLL